MRKNALDDEEQVDEDDESLKQRLKKKCSWMCIRFHRRAYPVPAFLRSCKGGVFDYRVGVSGSSFSKKMQRRHIRYKVDKVDVDFLVVDSWRKDFPRVQRLVKLSSKGDMLLCKNANSTSKGFIWRSLVAQGSSRARDSFDISSRGEGTRHGTRLCLWK